MAVRGGWILGTALLAAPLLFSCSGPSGRGKGETDAGPPDVLLITLDTYRAGRAGCMGNPAGLSPALDRILRGGVIARWAYAPAPLTAVSHASLLTGLDPPSHGVRDNWREILPETIPTLATVLSGRGFRTAGFVAGFPLSGRFGFAQGFDHFDDKLVPPGSPVTDASQRPGREIVSAALAWLRGRPRSERWFLWAHFFDPHYPWKPSPPFDRLPGLDPYGAEIRETDWYVHRLLKGVQDVSGGRLPVVAVVTDHGEALGAHGELSHGVLLYRPTTRAIVGLAAPPGTAEAARLGNGIHEEVVRIIDVVPTLLDVLDIPADFPVEGRSLLEPHEETVLAYSETYYPEFHFRWSPLLSVRTERWSYIGGPDPELYDLRIDPGETRNVIAEHRDVAEALARELAARSQEPEPHDGAGEITAEAREQLMALGYVGGGGASGTGTTDKDPKELVEAANAIFRGITALAEGKRAEALQWLQHAYRVDPENVAATHQLGLCLLQMGQVDRARAYFQRTLELDPGAAEAYAQLASIELGRGRREEALRIVEEGIRAAGPDTGLLLSVGDIQLEQGRLEEARAAYRVAQEQEPGSPEPWIGLARVAARQAQEGEAADAWREAARRNPSHPEIPEAYREAATGDPE